MINLVVEWKEKGKEMRGTTVGYVATEITTFAIVWSGDKLYEVRLSEIKVGCKASQVIGTSAVAD